MSLSSENTPLMCVGLFFFVCDHLPLVTLLISSVYVDWTDSAKNGREKSDTFPSTSEREFKMECYAKTNGPLWSFGGWAKDNVGNERHLIEIRIRFQL